MAFSIRAATELDDMVSVDTLAPRDAARLWMSQHPYTVDYWIDTELE